MTSSIDKVEWGRFNQLSKTLHYILLIITKRFSSSYWLSFEIGMIKEYSLKVDDKLVRVNYGINFGLIEDVPGKKNMFFKVTWLVIINYKALHEHRLGLIS